MNLASAVGQHAQSQPDKPAIDGGKQVLTYRDLDLTVRRIAARLRKSGVGPGDLVAVRMMDNPVHAASLLAVARLGAIVLPMDWRGTMLEAGRLGERFKPKLALTDDQRKIPATMSRIGVEDLEKEAPDTDPPVAAGDDPFVYALTSGTTGESKGLVVTHNEMLERFRVFAEEGVMNAQDRFLAILPLAYAAGREYQLSLLHWGGTLIMAPTLFDPQELVKSVEDKKVSVLLVSPNVSRKLLALKSSGTHLLPHLRAYVSTTSKLTPEERIAIRARLAPHLIDIYGSTGSGPISVISGPADEPAITSAGHVTSGLDVEIVDEEGHVVAADEVGLVRLRGPRITKGLVGEVAGSMEGTRDGWYFPGDLGALDAKGFLHLHGRSADLIKRGGLMVHAQEVERVLMLHESVAEAAVVGVPSPELGEEVMAFIVVRKPVPSQELAMHCIKYLAPYKVPTRIEVIDALPRNANGKVLKPLLREKLAVA
jgi:acyl-coenzyme A synthetase/AMP-(fatty) acid ligase